MSDFIPLNELDRAIMAFSRSRANAPGLFRHLTQGELWFLVRYHPEIEGEVMELKNGSPLPFAMFENKEGAVVPLFSSEERVEEGLKKGQVPPRTFSTGAMPAMQVLEILGKTGLRAVLNKSCATGELVLLPNLMRDLADGTAFQPRPPEEQQHGRLKILNPADYPTDLIQPAFELMRRYRNFRAAWVFGLLPTAAPPAKSPGYQLLFLMDPRDDVVFNELHLAVSSAHGATFEVGMGLLDEKDAAYIAKLFALAPAFYVAADYRRPPGELA